MTSGELGAGLTRCAAIGGSLSNICVYLGQHLAPGKSFSASPSGQNTLRQKMGKMGEHTLCVVISLGIINFDIDIMMNEYTTSNIHIYKELYIILYYIRNLLRRIFVKWPFKQVVSTLIPH